MDGADAALRPWRARSGATKSPPAPGDAGRSLLRESFGALGPEQDLRELFFRQRARVKVTDD